MYCSALAEAKNKYFSKDLPSLLQTNPTKFWKVISPDRGTNRISLHSETNIPLSDNECSFAFNAFFSSMFTREDHINLPCVTDYDWQYMEGIEVTVEGIACLINNLKVSTSSGVDNISSKILKNTTSVSSKILCLIFKQSLSSGQLPSD